MIRIITLSLCALLTPSLAYYTFKSKIPNGDIVPHPCKPNYMWSGVGHTNPDGAGARNPFGEDFDNSGYQWTKELCRFDSDGDGKTNGEELGDPDCEWTEGSVPKIVTGITHPGICDPYGEGQCVGRDAFVDCTIEGFDDTCDVIKNNDISKVEFRFQQTVIPNTETNYFCQFFDLPLAGDYHIVADEGIIDNLNVVHHQLLFGCPDSYQGRPEDNTPRSCDMNEGAGQCNTIIAAWTVGYPGNCFGGSMGFRVGGTKGFKKFKLEIHYNNPMLVSGYTDMSGMRLYLQPDKPGVQDLGTFVVGQNLLEIPPGKSRVEFQGSCTSDCTRLIVQKPMYIITTLSHMHYMGRSQKTEVLRNGRVIHVLADDTPYDYDSPIIHKSNENPIEVLPGDEIRTTCVYSSMSRKEWVHYGDATNDEMCFVFLNYYPEDAVPSSKWCIMTGPLDTCDQFTGKPKYGCDWANFINISNSDILQLYLNVDKNCRLNGECTPECHTIVQDILNHPCMGENMNDIVSYFLQTYHEGAKFLGKIRSCMNMGHDDHDHGHDSGEDSVSCMECERKCHHGHDGDDEWDWDGTSGSGSLLPHLMVMLMSLFLFSWQRL